MHYDDVTQNVPSAEVPGCPVTALRVMVYKVLVPKRFGVWSMFGTFLGLHESRQDSTLKHPGMPMVKRPCQRLHDHALGIGDMLSGQGV